MRTVVVHLLVAAGLAVAALLAVADSLSGPARWSPDGLFYQARVYQLQGADRDDALTKAFQGPLGTELRQIDPHHSGNPDWVSYNARFYDRRLTVPLAATALEPVAGDRALLDVSLAGYVAAVIAVFCLLLLRFRLHVAAAVALVTALLPALTFHSSFPLTDSWGLALEAAALASGLLFLDRGRRWLVAWVVALLLLSFTRDSVWIPVLGALGLAVTLRSRDALTLLASGLVAALPAVLAVRYPMRELLAQMLNDLTPVPDASWGFVLDQWPGAVAQLLRADGGFVRDGAWYSAAYLIIGAACLFLLTRGRSAGSPAASFLKAATLASVAYVLVVPVFSAFRLELVCVPMAAFGLALAFERLFERSPVARTLPSQRSGLASPLPTADLVSERS